MLEQYIKEIKIILSNARYVIALFIFMLIVLKLW